MLQFVSDLDRSTACVNDWVSEWQSSQSVNQSVSLCKIIGSRTLKLFWTFCWIKIAKKCWIVFCAVDATNTNCKYSLVCFPFLRWNNRLTLHYAICVYYICDCTEPSFVRIKFLRSFTSAWKNDFVGRRGGGGSVTFLSLCIVMYLL